MLNPAVFEDGQVVPRVVLDKLMCDAEISRFMFAPDSQIINIGRAKRTFTGQLRRAIIARDKLCQFPRCPAPPRRCEGHHSKHWFRDPGCCCVGITTITCTTTG
ncbi:MAG: HNH endonuclease [Cellulomonas sp.]|nr:HNH endonuclease [Cellulomonas sp.]